MDVRAKILIVDDDPAILSATRRVLEQAGYETLSAPDGETALQTTRAQRPDLVLLDVNLPHMDGLEVCRRIKAEPALTGIFIIIMSSIATDSDSRADGLDIGADGYIARPIANRELLARVQAMLRIQAGEKALRLSEQKYRQLIAQASDGIFILAPDGKFLLANSKTCEMLGYAEQELLQANILDTYPPALVSAGKQRLNTLRAGENLRFERPMRRKDGSEFLIEATAVVLENGTLQSIFRDITERKLAEQALRESEDKFKYVFDHSVIGKSITLVSGEINVNQAFSEMLGYSREELQNRKWQEISHPDDLELTQTEINALLSNQRESTRFIKRYLHKNGSIIWAEVGTALRRDADGKPLYFLTSINDITARRQAEGALRESEDRYRQLVETLPDGVIVHSQGRVVFANPASAKIIGAANPADLSGKLVIAFVHPDYREMALKRIQKSLTEGVLVPLADEKFVQLDGTSIDVEVSAIPFSYAGQPAMLTVFNDITKRKQAEVALKEYNARLEAAVETRTSELREAQEQLMRQEKLAVLGQLAGGVGHELRNPLGIINNAVYFLRMIQPEADEKVREYLSIIDTETHTADKIISDLLDFSRIKSVDVEPVAVSDLIRRTLERFPPPENVRVTLNLPANLPVVYVDPRQMTQVLGNLVLNACQAMTEGGTLVISAKQTKVAGQPFINIAVKDTGVGILPENMKKLFEPLFTTKPKGIGLGLAVSQKLIEANGGRIEVESEAGKGSLFTVYLPAH